MKNIVCHSQIRFVFTSRALRPFLVNFKPISLQVHRIRNFSAVNKFRQIQYQSNSEMIDLDKDIAELKAEIEGYETGLNNASTKDKRLLLQAINSGSKTLNKLLDQKKAFLHVGNVSRVEEMNAQKARALNKESELAKYMSSHAPPKISSDLGVDVVTIDATTMRFPINDKNNIDHLIIRDIYWDFAEYIHSILQQDPVTYCGVIVLGPQGNSKSWSGMFYLWFFLNKGFRVLYRQSHTSRYYFKHSTVEILEDLAFTTMIDLGGDDLIYIHDCAADGDTQPSHGKTFLILLSSPNSNNYKQLERTNMPKLWVPSYSKEQLLFIAKSFRKDETDFHRMFELCGPSIRLTIGLAPEIATDYLNRSIQGISAKLGKKIDHRLLPASLIALDYFPEAYPPPNAIQAYNINNMEWRVASTYILDNLNTIHNSNEEEIFDAFLHNTADVPHIGGLRGHLLERQAVKVIAAGNYTFRCLDTDDGSNHIQPTIDPPLKIIDAKDLRTMAQVLAECRDSGSMYYIGGTFPAVDYYRPPNLWYQATISRKHSIVFETIAEICKVTQNPHFYFIVPEDKYEAFPPQPYTVKTTVGKTTAGEDIKISSEVQYNNLTTDTQEEIKNLERFAIKYVTQVAMKKKRKRKDFPVSSSVAKIV